MVKLSGAIKNFYEKKYKLLLIFTLILVGLALFQIISQGVMTGDFIHRGVTLKGGSSITIDEEKILAGGTTLGQLEEYLKEKFPAAEVSIRTLSSGGGEASLVIDSNFQEENDILLMQDTLVKKLNLGKEDYTIEVMGSSLGESFFKQLLIALLTAFLLMGIVVFIYFRTTAPSLAVMLAAFSDITMTLAIFNLTGIKLQVAGIAAFLMLVGYSVDTDILLTSRLLKRKEGTVMEKVYSAMKTGLTMTITTLVAVTIALLLVKNESIHQIMLILFIGLLMDMLMTWVQNVALLRIILENKTEKKTEKN
jgi:preprotein translocase subunit SecF